MLRVCLHELELSLQAKFAADLTTSSRVMMVRCCVAPRTSDEPLVSGTLPATCRLPIGPASSSTLTSCRPHAFADGEHQHVHDMSDCVHSTLCAERVLLACAVYVDPVTGPCLACKRLALGGLHHKRPTPPHVLRAVHIDVQT